MNQLPIEVRMADASDTTDVMTMLQQMDAEDGSERLQSVTAGHLRRVLADTDAPTSVLLAVVKEQIVGLAAFRMAVTTFGARTELYLDDLYVTREMRRRGVGHALMRRLAHVAQQRGAHRVLLNVMIENATAIRFYEDLGGTVFKEGRGCAFDEAALQRLVSG
ncbi:MAG: GNAT family N-acetyltransferase [Planctomycetota bacterium]